MEKTAQQGQLRIVPCETSGSHGGKYEDGCLALTMEAASTSETSVIFHQTTRRNNPENSHLQFVPFS
jgi:hypothetical protein